MSRTFVRRSRNAAGAVVLSAALVAVARSGHELPVYPSYYPHEIQLETVAPDRAANLLIDGKLHAYVGSEPRFAGAPPEAVVPVESLGSLVIVRLNAASSPATDEHSACAVVDTVRRAVATRGSGLIVHPYPVTPFHGDYLHHADLADAVKVRLLEGASGAQAPAASGLKVKVGDGLASSLVAPEWRTSGSQWDAEVVAIDVAALVAPATFAMNGWLGPPWARTGWFHAHLLLGDSANDLSEKRRIADDLQRLQSAAYDSAIERINLERDLVAALAVGCRTAVVGYTVKREYVNAEFSTGIENIGYDALAGLNSPMFIRTVKLKDFPWNGWLTLGLDARPAAAWNPIGGLNDEFGRLMWGAVGDPALLPSPYGADWMLNRASDVQLGARP